MRVFSDARAQGDTVLLNFVGISGPEHSDERAEQGQVTMESEVLRPWWREITGSGPAADLELSPAAAGAGPVALVIAATARALHQPLRAGWCGKGGTETGVLRAKVFEVTRVQQR